MRTTFAALLTAASASFFLLSCETAPPTVPVKKPAITLSSGI